jgi:predicted RNase H-like nuclease (RuvC/YqgF family)
MFRVEGWYLMRLFNDLINSYPFYQKCRELWMKTQINQVIKGLQKYPEPFDPMHWTPNEIVNHAMEEAVDLVHYLVGLSEHVENLESKIKNLNRTVTEKEQEIAHLKYVIASFKNKEYLDGQKKPGYADLDD